jgi:hypothetical protein
MNGFRPDHTTAAFIQITPSKTPKTVITGMIKTGPALFFNLITPGVTGNTDDRLCMAKGTLFTCTPLLTET